MQEAAARHQFERAAVLRNQWQALSRLDRQLGRLRRCAETIHGVMTCPVSPSRRLWTVFRGGRVAATLLEPRSHRQAEIAKATLEAAAKQAVHPTSNILEINLQLIVASWFKKAPSELTKLVPIEEMVAECQSRRDAYRRTA